MSFAMNAPAITDDALMHAICLDGVGGGRNLTWAEVQTWTPQQGALWLHLAYTSSQAQAWLNAQDGLPKIAIDALLMPETRPRAAGIKGSLLLTLRGIDHAPGAEADDMIEVRTFSDGIRTITTSRSRVLALGNIASDLEVGEGPRDAAAIVIELAAGLAQGMEEGINSITDQMDDYEDRVVAGEIAELRTALASARRVTIGLHRYLLPQRDALAHLALLKLAWLDDSAGLQIREVGDWIIRYIEDLDSVRDRAMVMHEELLNRVSEQINRRMYVLSVVAAIFLPLSFLTGLLGVNLGGLPGGGSADVYVFWVFCVILLAVVGLQALLFRWMRWF